ncbi:MAG TPA: S53 family peptidase [Gemmataceae bacterium]|nr:S53 family peptidase [Gemmataceae bacterium]
MIGTQVRIPPRARPRRQPVKRSKARPRVEELEVRALLSAGDLLAQPLLAAVPAVTNPTPPATAYTPAQIKSAYGFTGLGDGSGQTIALVEAFHDPNLAADLAVFDQQYGLGAPPQFVEIDQNGNDPSGLGDNSGWSLETALDVEWAHAIAPGANILVVESRSERLSDMLAAVDQAATYHTATLPSASVVSMSWGFNEFSGEVNYDGHFNKAGVTFLAASGDSGAPPIWPAASRFVVAVGGTTLPADASGNPNVAAETGWGNGAWSWLFGGSGGGPSRYETRPGYQSAYLSSSADPRTVSSKILSGGKRLTPDVAYDSDPSTGFAVYSSDPYQGQSGWFQVGGTSDAAPQWAGLVAIADQARGAGKALSSSDTLSALYQMAEGGYSTNYLGHYNDILSGNNGYPAGTGYDLVTGLGSPKAGAIVTFLTAYTASTPAGSSPTTGGTGGTGGKGHPHLALPSPAADAAAPTPPGAAAAASDALPLPVFLLTANGGTAAAAPVAFAALPVGSAAPLPGPVSVAALPAAQAYLIGGSYHAQPAEDGTAAAQPTRRTAEPNPAPAGVPEANEDAPPEMSPGVTVRPPECDACFSNPRWAAAAAAPVVPSEEGGLTAAGAAVAVALGAGWAVPGEKRRRRPGR